MTAVGAEAVSFLRAGDGPQSPTLGGPGADGAGAVVGTSCARLASETAAALLGFSPLP